MAYIQMSDLPDRSAKIDDASADLGDLVDPIPDIAIAGLVAFGGAGLGFRYGLGWAAMAGVVAGVASVVVMQRVYEANRLAKAESERIAAGCPEGYSARPFWREEPAGSRCYDPRNAPIFIF